jgi:hypothetical protein
MVGRGPFSPASADGKPSLVPPLLGYHGPVRILIRVHVHRSGVAFMNRPGLPVRARMRRPRFRARTSPRAQGLRLREGHPSKPVRDGRCWLASSHRQHEIGTSELGPFRSSILARGLFETTASLYGDLQVIAGRSLQKIAALEVLLNEAKGRTQPCRSKAGP